MSGVSREQVLCLYDEGVDAFARLGAPLTEQGWERPACGRWSAVDLTRHVAAVAGWYHEWLDRAEGGDAAPPFGAGALAPENERALASLADVDGPAALGLFVTRARAYRQRLPAAWEMPYGYPRGTVTAGLHAAVAACEWHLHTWDLARSGGSVHRPSEADALYRAAGACLAKTQGGLKGRIAGVLVPVGARLRPWESLLRRSGRAPGAED